MAYKTQGALLSIETVRASAKTITAITAANPGVVSSTAHGYTNGQIVAITGIVGMVQLNNRIFQVNNVAANTFELKGVDTTAYTAYSSGGSAFLLTLTPVGQVQNVDASGGAAADIDVTHLQSLGKEYLIGLPDQPDYSFQLWMDNSDTGQSALRAARDTQVAKGFTLLGADGKTACFPGLVKQFGWKFAANSAAEGNVAIKGAAARAEFA